MAAEHPLLLQREEDLCKGDCEGYGIVRLKAAKWKAGKGKNNIILIPDHVWGFFLDIFLAKDP